MCHLRRQAVPFLLDVLSKSVTLNSLPLVGMGSTSSVRVRNTYLDRLGNGKTMHVLVAALFAGFEVTK